VCDIRHLVGDVHKCYTHNRMHECGIACKEMVISDGQRVCRLTGRVLGDVFTSSFCATKIRVENDQRGPKRQKVMDGSFRDFKFTPTVRLQSQTMYDRPIEELKKNTTKKTRRFVKTFVPLTTILNSLRPLFIGSKRNKVNAAAKKSRQKRMNDAAKKYLKQAQMSHKCGNRIDMIAHMRNSVSTSEYVFHPRKTALFEEQLRVLAIYIQGAWIIVCNLREEVKAYYDQEKSKKTANVSNGQSTKCQVRLTIPVFVRQIVKIMSSGGMKMTSGDVMIPPWDLCTVSLPNKLKSQNKGKKTRFKLQTFLWLAERIFGDKACLSIERCVAHHQVMEVRENVQPVLSLSMMSLPLESAPYYIVEHNGSEPTIVCKDQLQVCGFDIMSGPFDTRDEAEQKQRHLMIGFKRKLGVGNESFFT